MSVWSAARPAVLWCSAWCPSVTGAAQRREVRLGVAGVRVGTRSGVSVVLRVVPVGGGRGSSPRGAVVGGLRWVGIRWCGSVVLRSAAPVPRASADARH
ncbi:hypothetical protein [Gemmata obscuriglobus]|uniref:hypothetical protein n=1 Tax=Gemmata obscuriglobus TaxID=114 RepID=UPI0012FAB8DE|nr:hypothetical protein [Gemmata obscuriglobus]